MKYWAMIISISFLGFSIMFIGMKYEPKPPTDCSVIKSEYDNCKHNQRVFMGTAEEK